MVPAVSRAWTKYPAEKLRSAASPGSVGLAGAWVVRSGLLKPFAAGPSLSWTGAVIDWRDLQPSLISIPSLCPAGVLSLAVPRDHAIRPANTRGIAVREMPAATGHERHRRCASGIWQGRHSQGARGQGSSQEKARRDDRNEKNFAHLISPICRRQPGGGAIITRQPAAMTTHGGENVAVPSGENGKENAKRRPKWPPLDIYPGN